MTTLTQQLEATLDCNHYVSTDPHHPGHDDLAVADRAFPSRPRVALPTGDTFITFYRHVHAWWIQVAQSHLAEAERVMAGPLDPSSREYARDCLTRARNAQDHAHAVSPQGLIFGRRRRARRH